MLDALQPERPLGRMARKLAKRTPLGALLRAARRFNYEWLMRFGRTSYSLEGEDILLSRLFFWQRRGFFVDVGAYHPVAISNTYLFYRRGWRGINIEPTPGAKRLFDRRRPHDINLELAIGTGPEPLPLHVYPDAVFNRLGTVPDLVIDGTPALRTVLVPVVPLAQVLERHADGRAIDFLSVDVEGAELDVLGSNDWTKFRPKIICAELLRTDIVAVPQHPVGAYLASQGYRYFAKTGFSCFFRDQTQPL